MMCFQTWILCLSHMTLGVVIRVFFFHFFLSFKFLVFLIDSCIKVVRKLNDQVCYFYRDLSHKKACGNS